MREHIGEAAGKLWRALGERGEINLATLPKLVKEKNEVTFQALGWLAHEGKIIYKRSSGRDFVALTPHEQEIFKTIH
ncbi:MAG: winged helix-turn-helix domain-containing protein [bacterium]